MLVQSSLWPSSKHWAHGSHTDNWSPSLGIFSQVIVLGWAYKQLKAKSYPKSMGKIFLKVWWTPSLLTWLPLVSGPNSLVLPPAVFSWDVEAHAKGGHSFNSQDSFQDCLFEEISTIELADFDQITVCKTAHWKPVTNRWLKNKCRFP